MASIAKKATREADKPTVQIAPERLQKKEKKSNDKQAAAQKKAETRLRPPSGGWIVLTAVLFLLSGFALLALRGGQVDPVALLTGALLCTLYLGQYFAMLRFFPYMDRTLHLIVHFLCGLGILLLYRFSASMGIKQLAMYLIASCGQVVVAFAISRYNGWWKWRYVLMGGSFALLLTALVFGREINGAFNWVKLGGFSVQPSELVKVTLVLVLALYFERTRRLRDMLPGGLFAILCVGVLVLQKDLGAVLIYFLTAISLYYIATSDWILTVLGLAGSLGGAALCYKLFSHVRVRVQIWRNPWATSSSSGYQIVQGLIAIGSGGLLGLGLGQGMPTIVPVYASDFIFAALCEEFGVVMGLLVLALYAVILVRGGMLAMGSRTRFPSLVAFGATSVLAVQTLMIVGGVINMIPLTGVTLPFISSGGSSLLTCLALVGMLQGVATKERQAESAAWKRAREQMRRRGAAT